MLIGEFITQQEKQQNIIISSPIISNLKPLIFSINRQQSQNNVKLSGTSPSPPPLSPLLTTNSPLPENKFGNIFQTINNCRRRSSVYSETNKTTSRASSSSIEFIIPPTTTTATIIRNPLIGNFEQQLSRSLESLSMDELFSGQSPIEDKQQKQKQLIDEQQQTSSDDQLLKQIIETLIEDEAKTQQQNTEKNNLSMEEHQKGESSSSNSSSFRQLISSSDSTNISSLIKQEPLINQDNSNILTNSFPPWSTYRNLFPSNPAMFLRNFEISTTSTSPTTFNSTTSSISPTSVIAGTSLSQIQQLPMQLQQQQQFTIPSFQQHSQQQQKQQTYQQQQRRQTISCSIVTTNQQQQQQQCSSILTMAGQQQQQQFIPLETSSIIGQQSGGGNFVQSAANLMRGFGGMFSPQNIVPSITSSTMSSSSSSSIIPPTHLSPIQNNSTPLSSSSAIASSSSGQSFNGGSPSSSQHPLDDDFSIQIDEQKLCAVCNDYAVCQHYGALTCEGCKGFFKRTVQKKSQYVCAGNKNCPIDKKYRSRCQYCRFQKCLDVGMVREIVRYGSLQGRRGRLPSKVKSSSSINTITTTQSLTTTSCIQMCQPEPQSPPLPILTIISKAFTELHGHFIRRTDGETKQQISLIQFCSILEVELQSIWAFARRVPDITELNEAELRLLVLHNFFPIFAVRQAFRWVELKNAQISEDFWFEGGICLKIMELPVEWRKLFSEIASFANNFRLLVDWDVPCLASLLVLQIFKVGPNISGMITHSSIDRFHSTYINALKDHCCQNLTQPSKLSRIVAQVSQFEPFRQLGAECLSSSLRQLPPTQQSPTLTQLYLQSGGNIKLGGTTTRRYNE